VQPEITSCSEIKAGMLFYSSISQEKVFEVVRRGDYQIKDGKKTHLDNRRSNKWYCRRAGSSGELMLFCFDQVFTNRDYNFRMP